MTLLTYELQRDISIKLSHGMKPRDIIAAEVERLGVCTADNLTYLLGNCGTGEDQLEAIERVCIKRALRDRGLVTL